MSRISGRWALGWRDEILTALDEWITAEGGSGSQPRWRRVGRAIRTGDGIFTADVRGSELNPDQLDNLKLAGPDQDSLEAGFAVLDMSQSGTALTVHVAEFADPAEPYLWIPRGELTRSSERRPGHQPRWARQAIRSRPGTRARARTQPTGTPQRRQPPSTVRAR